MISKQHFIRAAQIVDNIRQGHWTNEPPTWATGKPDHDTKMTLVLAWDDPTPRQRAIQTAEAFIALFGEWNPRFDTQRFLVACGLVEAPVKAKKARTV